MVSTELIQIKVPQHLKMILTKIAGFKGLTVSAFIKMNLTEIAREEERKMYTENGLTVEEEQEILKRSKESDEEYKKGKMRFYSAKQLIRSLNA